MAAAADGAERWWLRERTGRGRHDRWRITSRSSAADPLLRPSLAAQRSDRRLRRIARFIVPKNLGYAGIAGIRAERRLYAAAAAAILYRSSAPAGRSRPGQSRGWPPWPPAHVAVAGIYRDRERVAVFVALITLVSRRALPRCSRCFGWGGSRSSCHGGPWSRASCSARRSTSAIGERRSSPGPRCSRPAGRYERSWFALGDADRATVIVGAASLAVVFAVWRGHLHPRFRALVLIRRRGNRGGVAAAFDPLAPAGVGPRGESARCQASGTRCPAVQRARGPCRRFAIAVCRRGADAPDQGSRQAASATGRSRRRRPPPDRHQPGIRGPRARGEEHRLRRAAKGCQYSTSLSARTR